MTNYVNDKSITSYYYINLVHTSYTISTKGGAKNFAMKARLREVFRRGLMKAALSTG